ncbi:TniB family NTP-binding protein [Neptuniibacter sp. QD37_6]|uniref:TniB family NTP-binding protein n=1 Tax=Neptuniibacter sp. QD37_6 TaxID=3398210 RepID=UPI0039F5E732
MTSKSVSRKPQTEEFESKVIRHPWFKQAYQIIEQVHLTYSPLSSPPGAITYLIGGAEPEGAVILGDTGSGKTTVLQYYCKQHAVSATKESEKNKVLYVPIPPKATTKKVVKRMLFLLGRTEKLTGNEDDLVLELHRLMWELGTELIIFDEINHLLPRNAGRSTVDICDFFKSLMNDTKIPLVLAGTLKSKAVLLSNDELADRLNAVQYLNYFTLPKRGEKTNHFKAYMQGIEQVIPVEGISLTSAEMLKRFFVASSGIPRRIARIVTETMQYADLSAPLAMSDYHRGYTKALRARALKPNPFDANYKAAEIIQAHRKKDKK